MRMVDIIEKKRDGETLTSEEIEYVIQNYTSDEIPDYQMSALLMAIYYNGMSKEECIKLTEEILNSGKTIDLSKIKGIRVDKHSTGGVGDKVTLVLGPLVASTGLSFTKMSGRGLGYTGGTIDKLESIDGFKTNISLENFYKQVNDIKIAIIGQTEDLAPADKKIYALRDVTGTVDSIPLIASSIMAKKLAGGADKIVLDVKVGHGAFMKNKIDATILANTMVEIGKNLGKETVAYITDMNEPLGYAVGNILEVKEAIDILKGKGPKDVLEVSLALASEMLVLGKIAPNQKEARKILKEKLESEEAFKKFREFVKYQGGNVKWIDNPDLIPKAKRIIPVYLNQEGYVASLNALNIGKAARILGAGRNKKEDDIDPLVGVVLNCKVGDRVTKDTPVAYLHVNDIKCEEALKLVTYAYKITRKRAKPLKIIHGVVR
ncbi:MAG TPA: pyrimidine-nucleoside phosphorylase [Tenericutes bacterium]|nr:pyrimidine-nucleoside phosphorylase [Mycoplasmatota bacterium]